MKLATYEEIYSRLINDETIKDYLYKSSLSTLDQEKFLKYIIATFSHYSRKESYLYDQLPKDFVVIDIETASRSKNTDIVQLSGIKYANEIKIDQFDTYLKPKQNISLATTYLTGIDDNTIDNAPQLDDIREKFIQFVGASPIVGHNIISFDIPRLKNNGVDLYDHELFDTMNMAKAFNLASTSYSLEDIKKYYGISGILHNALSDCEAEGKIYLKFLHKDFASNSEDMEIDDSFLKDKRVVISGSFSPISKNTIKSLVQKYGGKETSKISKKTDFFFDGVQVARNLVDGVHSQKELDAQNILENGNLTILTKDEIVDKFKELGEIL